MRRSMKGGRGPLEPNQARRVVQKHDASGPCRWEPPQSGLMRPYGSGIYRGWMRSEAWVTEGPAPSMPMDPECAA